MASSPELESRLQDAIEKSNEGARPSPRARTARGREATKKALAAHGA